MAADRAINMALRLLGIGEAERDFKRVGDAGSKSFAEVRKSTNGAAQEVSEYTRRLRAAVAEAKKLANQQPALNRPTLQSRRDRASFIKGAVGAEQERMLKGLPDVTRELGAADAAADGLGARLGGLGGASAGAALAFGALVQGVRSSVEAFIEHEKALDSFSAAMVLAGNQSKVPTKAIEDMAKAAQDASGQTEAAVLTAATKLAQVPGLTQEAFQQAIKLWPQLTDLGGAAADAAENMGAVLSAIANNDMPALIKATEGLEASQRLQILQMAEAGKTAEATAAYFDLLNRSVGENDGLTQSTNQLSNAWDDLKAAMGENIAGPVGQAMDWLTGKLRDQQGELEKTRFSWSQYFKDIGSSIGSPLFGTLGRGDRPFGREFINRDAMGGIDDGSRNQAVPGFAQGLLAQLRSNTDATKELKTFVSKYDKDSKSGGSSRAGSGASQASRVGDMRALIETLFPGAIVTSTVRNDPGSDHDRKVARAIDFVPSGGMGAMTVDQVRQVLTDAGVDIRRNAKGTEQLFGPGRPAEKPGDHDDHFHVAFDSVPDSDRLAARQRDTEQRRLERFQDAAARLDDQLLSAKRGNVRDAAELARLARDDIAQAAERSRMEVEQRVAAGDMTKVQADELRLKIDSIEKEQLAAADFAEAQRVAGETLDLQMARFDIASELLGEESQLAETASDRRKIELSLLDIAEKQERLRLEALRDDETASAAAREEARLRLAVLGQIGQARREGVLRGTAGPAEGYLREIEANGRSMDERFEAIGVGGLQGLTDGLADAVLGFRSLGDVARSVLGDIASQFLKLEIEQNITRPLARALFPEQAALLDAGGGGGASSLGVAAGTAAPQVTALGLAADRAAMALMAVGGGNGASGGGLLGTVLGIGSSILGGGVNADAASSVVSSVVTGFAGGGRPPEGMPFWVGENGRELMEWTRGGGLRVASHQQSGYRMADRGVGTVIQQNITVPRYADPRRTASAISRGTQVGMARAARKNLAAMGNR